MVDISAFRNGMAQLTGAVNVITTDGPSGRAGFTATAVCSVTDQPPTLLVCMNRNSWAHAIFATNRALCVNVLSGAGQATANLFADRNVSLEERFARVTWQTLSTGSPALAEALVSFDCRIMETHEVGSHSVFYCQVEQVQQHGSGSGLVYFNRAYHTIGTPEAVPA